MTVAVKRQRINTAGDYLPSVVTFGYLSKSLFNPGPHSAATMDAMAWRSGCCFGMVSVGKLAVVSRPRL